MNLFRSDLQVALHDLYLLAEASVLHHEDAMEFVDDPAARVLFAEIADERSKLQELIAEAIRSTDDLPSDVDQDREAGEKLLSRLGTIFSSNQTAEIVAQRLQAETALEQSLKEVPKADLRQEHGALLESFAKQVRDSRQRLQRFHEEQQSTS